MKSLYRNMYKSIDGSKTGLEREGECNRERQPFRDQYFHPASNQEITA